MSRLPAALRPHDPGRFGLHNGIRTAVVATFDFWLGLEVVGNAQTALFAAIGSLALLVFVDFGGPRTSRLAAYVGLGIVGAILVPLGTVVSTHPLPATLAMAVIAFVILFAGIINGYLAAGATAALLTYILPAMIPVDAGEWDWRLLGWGIACATAIPAALLLWPTRPRDALRLGVAAACRAMAELVARPAPATADAARDALDALHERWAATPFRPTGPTGAAGALAAMIEALDWLRGRASHSPSAVGLPPRELTASETELRAATAEVLRQCAQQVDGLHAMVPDLERFERQRDAVLADVVDQVADPAVCASDDRLWSTIGAGYDVRIASYGAGEVAMLAMEAAGGDPRTGGPRWARFVRRQRVGSALAASGRLAAAHTSVRSIWFRNSVRGATALALAVLLAQLVSLQHEFWVVLGALSVLRSSALTTGSTVVQALIGTAIGIVVGAIALLVIGTDTAVFWVLLPIAVFLAAYAPRAFSFAAAQAAFTVAVIIMFNLIAPTGWEVGLVRIEDVALGCAISLVVGVLFWPRGATALVRRSLGAGFAGAADYAAAAFARLAGDDGGADVEDLRREALADEGRMDAAYRQELAERGDRRSMVVAHGRLIGGAIRVRHTADAVVELSGRIHDAPRPPAVTRALLDDVRGVRGWYERFGAALAEQRPIPPPQAPEPESRAAVLAGVRGAERAPREEREAAVLLAWGALHVERAREHEARMVDAAS